MTRQEFARHMGISADEVENMLDGKALDADVSRAFIRYFGRDAALRYLEDFADEADWDAIEELINGDYRFSDGYYGEEDVL